MTEQRMVDVSRLKEVSRCLEDVATGKGGWAWEDVLDELRAIISGPGVEPVAEWAKAENGNYAVLKWYPDYIAKIGDKLYLAARSATKTAKTK